MSFPEDVRLFIVFINRKLHTSGALNDTKASCDWKGPAVVPELKYGLWGLILFVQT